MSKIGIYPGSFNPPTSAHIAIATAAMATHRLTRLDITVSESALGKGDVTHPAFTDRIRVLELSFEQFDNIVVKVTDKQLLSEMSQGYDLLVLGGDKWSQIQEPRWYASEVARAEALASLPQMTVAARDEVDVPSEIRLPVDPAFTEDVSSTAARAGQRHMMTEAALAFARESGAWLDHAKYQRWSTTTRPR